MSVINKMLRDLDRRQAEQAATRAAEPGQTAGVASVAGPSDQNAPPVASTPARWWLAALLLLFVLGGVYRLEFRQEKAPAPAVPAPAVVSASAAAAASAAPAAAIADRLDSAPVVAAAQAPVTPAPAPMAAAQAPTQAPRVKPEVLPKKELPAQSLSAPAARALVPERTVVQTPVRQPQRAVATAATPVAVPQKSPTQAAMEVLALAQIQWNEGDRAGAMQVVQGIIASLEKSPAGDNAALAAAAREFVRMATVQRRPADALAMLVRLEPQLAKVADIWALRGNTAQRLGLHAQAVHAYLNALDLQPGQARWLLAAAVSLAAQGQTTSAAEFADQARRAGFLPTDVANYLSQLGVVLQAP